jgi:hypothetical protein
MPIQEAKKILWTNLESTIISKVKLTFYKSIFNFLIKKIDNKEIISNSLRKKRHSQK